MKEVVAAAIIDERKNILLAKRSYPERLKNKWEFPGGKVEEKETEINALRREIREELCIEIEVVKNLFSLSHSIKEEKHSFSIYLCKLLDDKKDIDLNEHNEISWVNKDKLKEFDLAPVDKKIAKNLTKEPNPKNSP